MTDFVAELAALDAQALRRRRRVVDSPCAPELVVDGRPILAFCSNDYLGLAGHAAVRDALVRSAQRDGVGATAAHLLGGHRREHAALEFELADWLGRERASLFSSGWLANLGVVGALLGDGDASVQDKLNHASLLDAARLAGAHLGLCPACHRIVDRQPAGEITSFTKKAASEIIGPQPASYQPTEPSAKVTSK